MTVVVVVILKIIRKILAKPFRQRKNETWTSIKQLKIFITILEAYTYKTNRKLTNKWKWENISTNTSKISKHNQPITTIMLDMPFHARFLSLVYTIFSTITLKCSFYLLLHCSLCYASTISATIIIIVSC